MLEQKTTSGDKENLFFTSLRRLKTDVNLVFAKVDFLSGEKSEEMLKFEMLQREARFRLRFQAFLTIVILFGGGYIVLFTSVDDFYKKWITGIIGSWVGYWIR